MININDYIDGFSKKIEQDNQQPWNILSKIDVFLREKIKYLGDDYIVNNNIAIHKTAIIDTNVIMKSPIIIEKKCFIGANSYLRNGVFLAENVKIGIGCEIKSSILFNNSSIAHFNFIGDSIIGKHVNFEAGAIIANHYNERENKNIFSIHNNEIINTNIDKFGAIVGDYSKIGANAVLSPGTLLNKNTIVKRLELVEQIKSDNS